MLKPRKSAQIPDSLAASTEDHWLADAKKESCKLSDGNLCNQDLSLFATDCLVERTSFRGSRLHHAVLRDVRFVGCDFSNADLARAKLKRVEFVNCRLTGLRAMESEWPETLIEDCEASYAQFTDSKMQQCEFVGSICRDIDLRGTNLNSTKFERTDLSRGDLTRAVLTDTDLRGAEIESIMLRAGDLAGAIVTPAQAIELARFFGLKVR